MTEQKKNSKLKLVITLLILVGGIGFAFLQTRQFLFAGVSTQSFGPPPILASSDGKSPAPGGFPMNFLKMREEIKNRMTKDLDLNAEQQATIDKLFAEGPPRSPDAMRARFKTVSDMLSPEQKEKGRQMIHKQLLENPMSPIKTLPKEEQEKFFKKLDEKMAAGEPPMLLLGPPPGMGRPN